MPECFLNPTKHFSSQVDNYWSNIDKSVRISEDLNFKPKSKDSIIRVSKIKIPKKKQINVSETESPSKQSDFFDVTFSDVFQI